MTTAGQVLLGILAVVLGLCGACFVAVGSGGLQDYISGGFTFFVTGAVVLALAGLCIWGIILMGKR